MPNLVDFFVSRSFLALATAVRAPACTAVGGLGLRSWRDTADAATVAAYVQTSTVLPHHYPWTAGSFPPLLSAAASSTPLPHRIQRIVDAFLRLRATAPGTFGVIAASPTDSVTARHLQHSLSDRLFDHRRAELLLLLRHQESAQHPRHTAQYYSNLGDTIGLSALPTDNWTTASNKVWEVIIARRILAKIITTTDSHDNRSMTDSPPLADASSDTLQCPCCHKTSATHSIDPFGDHCFHDQPSGARTSDYHDPLRDCWLSLIKMAGLRTTKETPGLLLDSNGRPDHQVFFGTDSTLTDVRTCTITTAGYHSVQRAAALPGHSAECGALAKHKKWEVPARMMGHAFTALAHETGGRMAEETSTFLNKITQIAGGGDASDEARFRFYATSRLMMTNAIGAAKTILACMPFRYHATAMRTSPVLGHVPLPPPRQHRIATAPQLHTAPTTATNFALHFDFDTPPSPPAGGGAS